MSQKSEPTPSAAKNFYIVLNKNLVIRIFQHIKRPPNNFSSEVFIVSFYLLVEEIFVTKSLKTFAFVLAEFIPCGAEISPSFKLL